jgi:hypothetical protein
MGRKARLVALLWLALTVVAWNAVFDRIVIVEGRRYIAAAEAADKDAASVRIDSWMPGAVRRAFWVATGVGAIVGITGVVFVRRLI